MDGFKERLSHSIELRLSLWVSLAILVVAILGGAFSFAAAFKEAHEMQDDILRQIAILFDHEAVPTNNPTHDGPRDLRISVQYLKNNTLSPAELAAQADLPLPSHS